MSLVAPIPARKSSTTKVCFYSLRGRFYLCLWICLKRNGATGLGRCFVDVLLCIWRPLLWWYSLTLLGYFVLLFTLGVFLIIISMYSVYDPLFTKQEKIEVIDDNTFIQWYVQLARGVWKEVLKRWICVSDVVCITIIQERWSSLYNGYGNEHVRLESGSAWPLGSAP